MSENITYLDTSKMEVLSEFALEGDIEMLERVRQVLHRFRIAYLDGNILICGKTDGLETEKILKYADTLEPENRAFIDNWQKRDWWNIKTVFEVLNYDAVLQRLEETYDLKPQSVTDFNKIQIENGKDLLSVSLDSIVPQNWGRAVVTLQVINWRNIVIDTDRPDTVWEIRLTEESGHRLMTEMQRIRPGLAERNLLN